MIFERMLIERKFLSIYKGYFFFHYLSKLPFFERSLIRKNVKKQRFSKERHSKEKIEFQKNVI
jgi:hypothetical protein